MYIFLNHKTKLYICSESRGRTRGGRTRIKRTDSLAMLPLSKDHDCIFFLNHFPTFLDFIFFWSFCSKRITYTSFALFGHFHAWVYWIAFLYLHYRTIPTEFTFKSAKTFVFQAVFCASTPASIMWTKDINNQLMLSRQYQEGGGKHTAEKWNIWLDERGWLFP